jgi:hypothetical protein
MSESETWYRAKIMGEYSRIDTVPVQKSTDSSVWVHERRCKKLSSFESYFRTHEEAYDHIVSELRQVVVAHQATLNHAEGTYHRWINDHKREG